MQYIYIYIYKYIVYIHIHHSQLITRGPLTRKPLNIPVIWKARRRRAQEAVLTKLSCTEIIELIIIFTKQIWSQLQWLQSAGPTTYTCIIASDLILGCPFSNPPMSTRGELPAIPGLPLRLCWLKSIEARRRRAQEALHRRGVPPRVIISIMSHINNTHDYLFYI